MRNLLSMLAGVCMIGCLSGALPALASDYPTKASTMVVPFAPGGGNDRICRTLDTHAAKIFGKNSVFEYKEGAGGLIGSAYLSDMKPDGYVLGNVNAPQIYIYADKPGSPFKVEGLTYLFQLSSEPMVLVTPKGSALDSFESLLKYCQENPGKLSVGIASGFNSSAGFSQAVFQEKAGIRFNPVPLKGGADLTVNLLGNHVQAGIGNMSVVLNEMDKLNFLAVTSDTRDIFLPNVPTFKEKGVEIIDRVRRLIVAPKGIDPALRAEITEKYKKVFDQPAMKEEMMRNAWAPEWIAGEELDAIIAKENAAYKQAMKLMKK